MKVLPDETSLGEVMMKDAMDALRIYHEARGHASPEEVERLGFRAVKLMEEAQEYQRRVLGQLGHLLR
ncbi:hypothetical protein D3C81_630020 [compost metagenome]